MSLPMLRLIATHHLQTLTMSLCPTILLTVKAHSHIWEQNIGASKQRVTKQPPLTQTKVASDDHNAHHWLKLGLVTPAIVKEIQISTRWFTGNQVLSIAVILSEGVPTEILCAPIKPDSNTFRIKPTEADECLVRCFHEG